MRVNIMVEKMIFYIKLKYETGEISKILKNVYLPTHFCVSNFTQDRNTQVYTK